MPKLPLYTAGKAALAGSKAMKKDEGPAGWGKKGTTERKIADAIANDWRADPIWIKPTSKKADKGDFSKSRPAGKPADVKKILGEPQSEFHKRQRKLGVEP